jgi:hypothetical protein
MGHFGACLRAYRDLFDQRMDRAHHTLGRDELSRTNVQRALSQEAQGAPPPRGR